MLTEEVLVFFAHADKSGSAKSSSCINAVSDPDGAAVVVVVAFDVELEVVTFECDDEDFKVVLDEMLALLLFVDNGEEEEDFPLDEGKRVD